MAFSLRKLEKTLYNLEQLSDPGGAKNLVSKAFEQHLVSKTSKLGTNLNQIISGFESLTQEADDVIGVIKNSRPEQLIGGFAVAQLTKNVPALKDRLVLKVGSDSTDLAAIAGSSVDDGFLQVQVTSSEPEAIAYHVKKTTNASQGQLKNVIGGLINLEDKVFESFEASFNELITPIVGAVANVVASFNKFRASLFSSVLGVVDNINKELNKGFGSIVENISEAITGNARSIVGSLTLQEGIKISLPESDMTFVLSLLGSKDQKKFDDAVKFLQQYSSYSEAQIRDSLGTIDNRLGSNIFIDQTGNLPVLAREITTGLTTWDYANTPKSHNFNYVATVEELEVDLKSMQREVTEVIVHWTETFNNQNIGSEELQDTLSKVGDSLPYHYLIRRDGSLQRGRPNQLLGGALANGHEKYSVQVAFVGGINAPAGTANPKVFLSSNSLTSKQMISFQQFCAAAYSAWPGVQILGHNDIDLSQRDPGFDVPQEMESLFNKRIVYEETLNQGPFTRKELITKRVI